jgi:hypothetical protein
VREQRRHTRAVLRRQRLRAVRQQHRKALEGL